MLSARRPAVDRADRRSLLFTCGGSARATSSACPPGPFTDHEIRLARSIGSSCARYHAILNLKAMVERGELSRRHRDRYAGASPKATRIRLALATRADRTRRQSRSCARRSASYENCARSRLAS
jgi:hypothetical protein